MLQICQTTHVFTKVTGRSLTVKLSVKRRKISAIQMKLSVKTFTDSHAKPSELNQCWFVIALGLSYIVRSQALWEAGLHQWPDALNTASGGKNALVVYFLQEHRSGFVWYSLLSLLEFTGLCEAQELVSLHAAHRVARFTKRDFQCY